MTYTTQELIEILDQELRASWKGQRIVLSSENRINNPVVTKAIDMHKVNKVFAYRDFRQEIHQYQRQNQVSGIIWRRCNFGDQTISFPEVHNQLIAVGTDKEILMAAKESVINFWLEITKTMNFWLAGEINEKIMADRVENLVQQSEWADIDAALTEVYLGLYWGNPQECQYHWAKPKSGCHRIIATHTEPSSIKVY